MFFSWARAPFREAVLSEVTLIIRIIAAGDRQPVQILRRTIVSVRRRIDRRGKYPVKQTQTERDQTDLEATPASPGASPNYVTVYTFVIWDHDKGATVIYPRMATLEAIAKMRGKVNEDTAWVVDASDLDVEGFYSGGSSR